MKIAIVSDACDPPTNGVSRTLGMLQYWLQRFGHEVYLISPPQFRTVPCLVYPDIRLAVAPRRRLAALLEAFAPDAIHIATEGPLGFAARAYCIDRDLPFTTMFTTKFPEVLHAHFRLPVDWTYALERWFHGRSSGVMVATRSLHADLSVRGFRHLRLWSRGVDPDLFRPRPGLSLPYPRPIYLYVGRIAVEKSLERFLELDLDGTKLVVGDGPLLPTLRERYPDTQFVGSKRGEDLAHHYAASDVFVFPSCTDTFGLVLLEALASGLPIAAYPVTGPLDIIGDSGTGVLDHDLGRAARAALAVPRERCRAHAMKYTWEACARQFVGLLHRVGPGRQANGDADETRQAPAGAHAEVASMMRRLSGPMSAAVPRSRAPSHARSFRRIAWSSSRPPYSLRYRQ